MKYPDVRLNIVSAYEGVFRGLTFELVDQVKQMAPRSVDGHHLICWGPE
jgi:hypothetical protein